MITDSGDFLCLNCLHSYSTKNELKKHKSVCKNHDYCFIEMPKESFRFIASFRFMSSLFSSLVDNLSEGLHNNKCTDCKYYLQYISTKHNQLIFNCLKRNKNHNKDFNKTLLPDIEDFYSNLNMEDTTYADYEHARKCKNTLK